MTLLIPALAERQSILSRALIRNHCHISFMTPSINGPFLSSMSQHYSISMSSSSSRHETKSICCYIVQGHHSVCHLQIVKPLDSKSANVAVFLKVSQVSFQLDTLSCQHIPSVLQPSYQIKLTQDFLSSRYVV